MKKNRFKSYLLFLIPAAVIAVSCSRTVDKNLPELRYGFTTEPATLDPLSTKDTADSRSILFNVFEGLVKPDTAGIPQPCIAQTWTVEQGGLVYNFTLREGVRFHDGSTVKPSDVKFSLDTAISAGFNGLNNIKEVTIPSENQIRITLNAPDLEFLPYLTVGVVKAENPDREKNIIGTGPFFIESYTTQRNLVLKKFDDYWKSGLPRLEKVTIVFVENSDALMVALRGGSIDGCSVTGSMAAQIDNKSFDIFDSYSAAVQLLALNNAVFPLDDARVRRALNYGIDVQNIIDTAFFGLGYPSGSPIIPGLSVYYEDSSYPYDPGTARALLGEAGFGEGNRLSLEITVPSNFTMHVDTAQVIASQLAKINVEVSIKLVDWSTWLENVYMGRQYQSTIISLDSAVISPRNFLSRYRSGNSGNFINFSNADFDRIFDSILSETDETKRIRLYKDAQRTVTGNSASVYIQDIFYYKAFRGGVFSGVLNYPSYAIDFASIYRIDTN